MPASAFPRRLAASLPLLTLALAAPVQAQSEGEALPETRGAWVLDTRIATPEAADATMRRLAGAGFNLALVRVWFQGGTVYPSDVVERAGGPRQLAAYAGRDPLADAIAAGRRHGVRVGAWMEYGLAERITAPITAPGPILAAHPDWRMRDRDGREHVAHGGGTRSYWMDPAHPGVVAFQRDLAVEVVTRYPDLAVFEADRFRYPDLSWSYAPAAVARYRAETGQPDPATQPSDHAPWVRWRREQVTRLMGVVYRAVKRANPSVVVSAAVVPPYMIDTGQDKLQHWPTWADSGYVDLLEPMLYDSDAGYAAQLARATGLLRRADGSLKVPIAPGISAETGSPVVQVRESRRQGATGVTVWYEGALSDTEAADLRAGPFAQTVLPDFDDVRVDDGDAAFALSGPWTTQATGYLGGSRRLAAGARGSASWRVSFARAGTYDLYARWMPSPENAARATYSLSGLVAVLEPAYIEVDQRSGSGWVRLGGVEVRAHPDGSLPQALVSLEGSPDGAVVADAVLFARVAPFRAEEVLAGDPGAVAVRFTYAPRAHTLVPANFRIDGAVVASVEADPSDGRVVRLTPAAPLAENTDYVLTVGDLSSSEGYHSERARLTFRLDPAAERLVDDADAAFSVAGAWASGAGDAVGAGFRTAPAASGTRATWSATVGGAGRYAVEVYVPAGVAGVSERMGYQVGSLSGFTTATVATGGAGGWMPLGRFDYRDGATGVVVLQGSLSAPGTLVADAVRWRRTLTATAAGPADAPGEPALSLGAFPNPARDRVTLRLRADAAGTAAFAVYDVLGRAVLRVAARPFGAGGLDESLDVAALPAGLYVARATLGAPGCAPRVVMRTFMRLP